MRRLLRFIGQQKFCKGSKITSASAELNTIKQSGNYLYFFLSHVSQRRSKIHGLGKVWGGVLWHWLNLGVVCLNTFALTILFHWKLIFQKNSLRVYMYYFPVNKSKPIYVEHIFFTLFLQSFASHKSNWILEYPHVLEDAPTVPCRQDHFQINAFLHNFDDHSQIPNEDPRKAKFKA